MLNSVTILWSGSVSEDSFRPMLFKSEIGVCVCVCVCVCVPKWFSCQHLSCSMVDDLPPFCQFTILPTSPTHGVHCIFTWFVTSITPKTSMHRHCRDTWIDGESGKISLGRGISNLYLVCNAKFGWDLGGGRGSEGRGILSRTVSFSGETLQAIWEKYTQVPIAKDFSLTLVQGTSSGKD